MSLKSYFGILLACIKGYFGTDCSQMCSSNCKPDTCRHTDGWCTCAAGWTCDNCTTGINIIHSKIVNKWMYLNVTSKNKGTCTTSKEKQMHLGSSFSL